MRRWSISTNRKLRAMRESLRRSAIRPTTALLPAGRHGGSDQRVLQLVRCGEGGFEGAQLATAPLRAQSGGAAVVTSASALAYRVATAESVISDLTYESL